MAVEHLWEVLSRAGKRVFGMNVPATYPPRAVNGILIGGFLSPSLEKCAFPASVSKEKKTDEASDEKKNSTEASGATEAKESSERKA